MSYGNSQWAGWVLEEEDSMKHLKAAFDMGIYAWESVNPPCPLYFTMLTATLSLRHLLQHRQRGMCPRCRPKYM